MVKEFEEKLVQLLQERGPLSTVEIYDYFYPMNPKTVSWHLFDCIKQGIVDRSSHGLYVLSSSLPEIKERLANISSYSQEIYDFMCSSGFDFYLSGMDCLNGLGVWTQGSLPVIICTRKADVKDVQLELMRHYDLTLIESETSMLADEKARGLIRSIILSSNDFTLQKGHFAFVEKAFVDLYYAVTRMEYPLPIEELPHLLSLFNINPYRFKRSTKDRHLSSELDFLLSYDKRFLKAFVDYIDLMH